MQKLLTGNDGKVRAAVIKTTDGKNNSQSLRRSIQHLIPIKVRHRGEVATPSIEVTPDPTPAKDTDSMMRPRRQAAAIGELKHRLNIT